MDDPCGEQSVDGGSASQCEASVAATILESCGSVDRALQDNVLHGDPFDSRALQDNVLHGDPFDSRALSVHSAASSSNVARLVGSAINDFCGHDDFPTLPNIPVPQWIRFATANTFSLEPTSWRLSLLMKTNSRDELPTLAPPGRPTRKRHLPSLTSHPVARPSTSRLRPVGALWLRPSRPPTPPSPSMPARSVTPPSPSPPTSPPSGSTPRSHAPSSPVCYPTHPLNLPFVPPSSPPSEPTPYPPLYVPLPSQVRLQRSPLPPLRPRPLPRRLIAFSHPRPVRLLTWVSPLLSLRPHNLALPWICPPLTCLSHRLNPSSLPPNFAGPARHLPRTASPRLVPMLSLISPCTLPSPPFPTRPALPRRPSQTPPLPRRHCPFRPPDATNAATVTSRDAAPHDFPTARYVVSGPEPSSSMLCTLSATRILCSNSRACLGPASIVSCVSDGKATLCS